MQIVLKDNRILAYAESGDPSGKPVFLFHGLPYELVKKSLVACLLVAFTPCPTN